MRPLLIILAGIVAAALFSASNAQAYPGCYYSYRGCYLAPGWYGGNYWYGGPWWGWGNYAPPMVGCPVPYETGACS